MEVLYIVMPAYNEEGNIHNVVDDWYSIVEDVSLDSRLLLIDDGSTDGTFRLLKEMESTHPQLRAITKVNAGHGPTVLLGYHTAIENGADWVFQTDSDRQTVPSEFHSFWVDRNDYDAIIGVRNSRQDGFSRKLVERILCLLIKLYFGVRVPDANAPFRLMRASVLRGHLALIPDNHHVPNATLTALFAQHDGRVSFREISFLRRQTGKNSINIRSLASIGWSALKDFRQVARQQKQSAVEGSL